MGGAPASAKQPVDQLFRGPHTLRFRHEWLWFWVCLLFAPATAGLIGKLLRSPFQASEIGIIIAIAVVYVTLSRGRLLGTSVRAHERQFPELFAVIVRCSQKLGMRVPHVFVREDVLVPITAMGLGEPYTIVISSLWLRHLDDKELEFLVGCELGHIAAGHTRISSLFSASGKENALVALIFGAWLRRTEYTAGRIGLLCCRSMEAAVRAIYAISFKELKGQVQHEAFLEQRHAIQADPSLAMGEWLGETPYAVNQITELKRFAQSSAYAFWSEQIDRRALASSPVPGAPERGLNASLYLRSLAVVVDAVVAGAIGASGALVVHVTASKSDLDLALRQLKADPGSVEALRWLAAHTSLVGPDLASLAGVILFMIYSALMVALIGRTCGMLVFDLRVVRKNGKPAQALRSVWRYLLALVSFVTVVPVLVGLVSGFWLHERLSGTRLSRSGPASF